MASDALRFLDMESPARIWLKTDILNKEDGIRTYINYMLDRTNKMFEWSGLPETIPARILELFLQMNGYAAFVRVDETNAIDYPNLVRAKPGIYVFWGGVGGERDIYYRPILFTLSNPRVKDSLQCQILYDASQLESDTKNPCVLMRSDSNYMGLMPLFSRYAVQLVENDISIRSAQINARAQVGISVSSDREAETARKYLDNLEAGKLAVMGETAFLDGISVANVGTQSANVIIQLIELQQYLKASWFNDLGLNANFNMKREYISREEIGSQTDVLLPLVDDMLECRKEAAKLINEIFDLNISVEKNSAWADKDQTILNSLAAGATEGDIPLIGDVADRLEEDTNVQLNRDPEAVSEGRAEAEATPVNRNGEPEETIHEEPEEAAQQEPEAAAVTVNVNINVDGGESADGESEASEESEKSDAE